MRRKALFIAKGFDDATMREIALRAGVGLGTIFLYAENKRDLLFLTINEQLEMVTQKAETADRRRDVADRTIYWRWRSCITNSSAGSRRCRGWCCAKWSFYDSGAQARPFQQTRERLISLFGTVVEMAAAQKLVALPESPQFIGWTIFCIFQVELRRWLSDDDLELRAGLRALERALTLFINGIKMPQRTSIAPRQV